MGAGDLARAARQVADTEHGVVATGNILVVTLNQRSQEKILDLLVSLRWAVLKQAFTQTTYARTMRRCRSRHCGDRVSFCRFGPVIDCRRHTRRQ